jgi:UDP-N-acetylglucosamine--N-acetylmuramyl-(pentapeptide) pyrophosphoryl-undecaprenol N-acetylglucosamine transferase
MRVLLAAGGTGGHINPALAAAQEISKRNPDAKILFVGVKGKMESKLVPKAGFDFTTINISGFQRSFAPSDIAHNIGTLWRLMFVTSQCKKIIDKFKPDVVVGFGGYVSGPVVRTAHKMGIKTAIHEQNALPGKTNIALSKYVDSVMLTTEKAESRLKNEKPAVITGLPVRDELLTADRSAARKSLGISDSTRLVLSTGGSLGAESINNAMCDVLTHFNGDCELFFVHGYGQLGRFVPDKLKENGIDPDNMKNARVSEYIYDMATVMSAADLVISRAGASSLAEIEVLGKASVLVPSPYVAENHQFHNAMALVEKNAAMVIEQKDLTSEKLVNIISELKSNPEKFREIGDNAKKMAVTDSPKRICDVVMSLADKREEKL